MRRGHQHAYWAALRQALHEAAPLRHHHQRQHDNHSVGDEVRVVAAAHFHKIVLLHATGEGL